MCTVLPPISENGIVLMSGMVLTRPIKVQVKNAGVHFLFHLCRSVRSTSFLFFSFFIQDYGLHSLLP